MKCKKIAVVGLGLIGGSILKALQGFENTEFYGIDLNADVIRQARAEGLIGAEELAESEILAQADVVFICLHPAAAVDYINRGGFKSGALVTDVCGIKRAVLNKITNTNVDFIGGHPMAGKEASGFYASDATLFYGASYLLTPSPENTEEHLALLKRMVTYMGCREVVMTTAEEHDDMIAYTSQLMHVVATVLCDSKRLDRAQSFSAGSLRDCTRVAKLDSRLWSQLFLENKDSLLSCIKEFEDSLQEVKNYLIAEDKTNLEAFLHRCSERKMKFFRE